MSNSIKNNNQLSALSQIFSARVIHELSRTGKSPILARILSQSPLADRSNFDTPLHKLFDHAFSLLKRRCYRDEYTYKSAITDKILLGRHSLNTAVMLTEFRVGTSKADIAVLNGSSTAYEIKSERDSIKRLESQIEDYRKVFAQVNVISGENHLKAIAKSVPDDVGLMILSNRHQITVIKEAQNCPQRTVTHEIFDSVRLSEAKSILQIYGKDIPDAPNTVMNGVLKELFSELTPVEAHNGMVQVLRKSRNLSPLLGLIELLPKSLSSAVLSTKLRKQDHFTLVNAIDTPLKIALAWN